MGILDKATKKAQELADKAQAKVDDVQSKRKSGDLLADLGRIVYGEKTGRPVPGAEARTAELVADLQAVEREGVQVLEHVPPPAPPPTTAAESMMSPPPPPPSAGAGDSGFPPPAPPSGIG
jgi:hypothetical protein